MVTKKIIKVLVLALVLPFCTSACGMMGDDASAEQSARVAELERRLQELEADKKQLEAQLTNTQSQLRQQVIQEAQQQAGNTPAE